jgi:CO/xanthine dehydrogenase FAD-binding subunit
VEDDRVRRFELAMPESVGDCVAALAELGPVAKPVAGGTDLLPQMKNGLVRPPLWVDLRGIAARTALQRGA